MMHFRHSHSYFAQLAFIMHFRHSHSYFAQLAFIMHFRYSHSYFAQLAFPFSIFTPAFAAGSSSTASCWSSPSAPLS